MKSKSWANYNTLNLESRPLGREELTTIDGRILFERVKNILFNARRKVASPEHGTEVATRLFTIMNAGSEAIASGNLELLKAFYADTYLPLVQQDMNFSVSRGRGDFNSTVDSEWSDYFTSSIDSFDSRMTEMKYGGDDVLTASYPMNGFGSADTGWDGESTTASLATQTSTTTAVEDSSTLKKSLIWGGAVVGAYVAYKMMTKKTKTKR